MLDDATDWEENKKGIEDELSTTQTLPSITKLLHYIKPTTAVYTQKSEAPISRWKWKMKN